MSDAAALRAWHARWHDVNTVTDRETASLTIERRLSLLGALSAFARRHAPADDDTMLWDRLQCLRTVLCDRTGR